MRRARLEQQTEGGSDRGELFAVLWAVTAVLHVFLNPRSAGLVRDVSLVALAHMALAAAALGVLWRPRSLDRLALLASLGLVTAWLEAPILGNHWLLAALLDIGILVEWVRRRLELSGGFYAAARLGLICFYAFAAFAKLNKAFLDPRASCATFYASQLKQSLHLGPLRSAGAARGVGLAVIAVELAIPVLLAIPSTRRAGAVVGLVYHGLIGLDATQLFGDFSSVLAALFVLFLPAGSVPSPGPRARRVAAGAAAVLLVLLWIGPAHAPWRLFLDGRWTAWLVVDAALAVAAARVLVASSTSGGADPLRPAGVLWIVPALVVFNGLTPYLELKTSYGWNMYSNLQTVAGHTNHLLLPGTLPLTGVQRDLVRIVATDDPALGLYAEQGYDLPFLQFRAYLSSHPASSVVYVRHGVQDVAMPAGSDRRLVAAVPGWEQKLLAFRAVDQGQPVRCQPTFLPAR